MPVLPRLPLMVFALATLAPLGLILAALAAGGLWVWAAFAGMALLAAMLDQIAPLVASGQEGAETGSDSFPAADALLVAIGLAHLALLPLAVWVIGGPSGLTLGDRALLVFACGAWMGQVVHPAAHELIHRPGRGLFRLGVAVYASLLMGHHASAHRLVHHRHVATPDDPSSAPLGMASGPMRPAPGSAATAPGGRRKMPCGPEPQAKGAFTPMPCTMRARHWGWPLLLRLPESLGCWSG